MTTHLITLVIKQPSDAQARQLMYQELLGLISRYGGEVTSKALEDESTLCELLEQMLPDDEVEQARKQVLELHAKRRQPGRLDSPASLKV
ncbi:TPA: hypothetical protein ACGJ7L_000910 [Pseudomonas aeruginosa]|jgi:hypothetical protein|uniref:dTDP-D-glucose 4,6-dehydratase n=6 Tax=Pseudomonas aeruginosa TaxID=287 RepID=A0A0F6UH05_PSEAI|nr:MULTISPECIES: hypothetical protein [Pseudomonas]CDI94785.1 hypothetical protein BN889_06782 [Pseudomonas aeruginosa PA38182]HCL2795716.1 hypothetical protein [Pseudomonas aeruginosa 7D9A]AKE72057.1 dTDP-glucose 4,6-dehydratase [Pseudomonas aeruginosa]ALY08311.1 dTDP-D-glucose 4,6-dehydratase [Pseudomonas aeruginosa]ALY42260.1 dTDP-glucose 4,6-dehydratase [Pseudomonas aeruginosa]